VIRGRLVRFHGNEHLISLLLLTHVGLEVRVGELHLTGSGVELVQLSLHRLILTLQGARSSSIRVAGDVVLTLFLDDLVEKGGVSFHHFVRVEVSELGLRAELTPHSLQGLTLYVNRVKHLVVKAIIDRVGDISVSGVVKSVLSRVLGRELLAVLGVLLINRHTIDLLRLALVNLVVRVLGNSSLGEVSGSS
jgi:hypothetical protein